MEKDGQHSSAYQRVFDLNDSSAEAYVVIDSFLGGGGTGGIRRASLLRWRKWRALRVR